VVDPTVETGVNRLARIIRAGLAAFVFVLILALFPLSLRPAIDVKVWLYQAAALLLAGSWIATVVFGWTPFRWPRLFGPVLVLTLMAQLVALAFSERLAAGSVFLSQTFCLWMLFLVASQVYNSAREAQPLLISICVGVVISSLYAFAQKAGIDPFPWNEQAQQTSTYLELPGTFGNPNVAGHALVLAIVLAVSLAAAPGTRWCALLVPIYGLHLYWTGFRAGLLALAGGAMGVAITWLAIRAKRSPVAAARITVATLLAFAGVAGMALFAYGTVQSSNYRLLDDSLMLRYNAYYGAAEMIADRPITGFGPGTYAVENPPYWTEYEQRWLAEKRLRNDHVHSDVLETWIETGVLGAVAYVLLLVCGVYYAAAHAARTPDGRWLSLGLVAFFVTFAIDGLFGFNGRVPVTAVMVMLAAGVLEGCEGFEGSRSTRRRVVATFLLLTILAASFVGTRSFVSGTYAYVARSALNGFAVDRAYEWGQHALSVDPNHPAARRVVADTALAMGRGDLAVPAYSDALEQRPHDIELRLGLARAHLASAAHAIEAGDAEETMAGLQRAKDAAAAAAALCPVFPDADELLGRVALMRAQLVDPSLATVAEKYFLDASRNASANAAAVLTLAANARLLMNDLDGAEEYFVRAVQRDPTLDSAWAAYIAFGTEHARLERAQSIVLEEFARAGREGHEKLQGNLRGWHAVTLARTGAPPERVADAFDAALASAPDSARIWTRYANEARERGTSDRFVAAVRTGRPVLNHIDGLRGVLDGNLVAGSSKLNTLAHNAALDAYAGFNGEDVAALLPYALEFIQSAPVSPAVIESLARIADAFGALGRFAESAEVYTLLAERVSGPRRATALEAAAHRYLQAGLGEEALAVLEPAMAQHGNEFGLRLTYARALAAAGKPAAARMELNALRQFQLDPEQRAQVDAALTEIAQ
jgi:O-antigen ligase/tetratricopeptide (TPR) repeat protein